MVGIECRSCKEQSLNSSDCCFRRQHVFILQCLMNFIFLGWLTGWMNESVWDNLCLPGFLSLWPTNTTAHQQTSSSHCFTVFATGSCLWHRRGRRLRNRSWNAGAVHCAKHSFLLTRSGLFSPSAYFSSYHWKAERLSTLKAGNVHGLIQQKKNNNPLSHD